MGFNITSEVAAAVFQAMQACTPEAKPVAVVDCSDDACWADILDDVTVKVGQKLYAAPITLPTTAAARDVLAERQRQVEVEAWTPEHDDVHGKGAMALAAGCYARHAHQPPNWHGRAPESWPWGSAWWKPSTPRRNLVKAGALIIAEIERLDRAASKEPSHG
ncbi:hypothetical protein D9M70_511900 [compost metagenome]